MFQFAGIKDFDWTMFFVVMIICGLGVLQIFSATHDTVWQGSWWKQIVYIAAGILLMWIATNIDYHALMTHVYPLYFASIVLLIAVLVDRQARLRLHALDRAARRHPPAGFRIRQDRHHPSGGALSDRTAAPTCSNCATC